MDELQISGKRFISAKRIARENGYTSDYVGQLIRGGKVVGQKVGRAWYVDAGSFDAYLGGEAAVVQIEQVPEPVPQPVTEIVTESPSIEKEETITASPTTMAQELGVVPIANQEMEATAAVPVFEEVDEPKEEAHAIHINVATQPAKVSITEPVKVSGLRYYQEDAPALPEIRSNINVSRMPTEAEVVEEVDRREPEEAFTIYEKRPRQMFTKMVIAVVAVAVFAGSAWLSSFVSLNLSISEGNTATISYGVSK